MTSERNSERGAADPVGRPMFRVACESAPFVGRGKCRLRPEYLSRGPAIIDRAVYVSLHWQQVMFSRTSTSQITAIFNLPDCLDGDLGVVGQTHPTAAVEVREGWYPSGVGLVGGRHRERTQWFSLAAASCRERVGRRQIRRPRVNVRPKR